MTKLFNVIGAVLWYVVALESSWGVLFFSGVLLKGVTVDWFEFSTSLVGMMYACWRVTYIELNLEERE